MDRSHLAAPVVALLELAASEHSELLDLQVDALLHSVMRSAVLQLASDFGVPVEKLRRTLHRTSLDLDRLEKRRGTWRDPAAVLKSPNLLALVCLCRARGSRVHGGARQRRLGVILGKLERAYELAKSRAWIEDFIGPPLARRKEVHRADR